MSDAQKLKDCITEYHKAHKVLDDKLNRIEADNRQRRQDKEAESSHQD